MTTLHQSHALLFGALTKEENLIMATAALVGVLLVGGIIMARVDRWRKRQMEDPDDSTGHLGSFREMYDRGELSKEEYDRVLRRMAERAAGKTKTVKTAEPTPGPTPIPVEDEPKPPSGPTD
ncbi:SHOCT domain-containing protein [Zavarzinella formosa]|uniref:hypothetical protein n=1 Tax=Zavarzinella formosa TaxID=360055 RepID=UPI0002E382DA|nr:hypothetical protein [Zavarzinella formosa]